MKAGDCLNAILKFANPRESYWAVLSCNFVYDAVQGGLTFQSLGEILERDHSNES